MSPAFDGSIHEIFSALSYGSELCLKTGDDPLAHIKAADAAILTPSVAAVLDPYSFPMLKTLYLVGEAVPQTVCNQWASIKTVYNMYGPTEATCGATIKKLQPQQPVSLGTPNPTTRIYILDSNRQLVMPGTVGQVYLAGVQVAAGYVGRPEETEKRFLPDTIHTQFNEVMYHTGDRGYWDNNGELMFLGRTDRQIKSRGFRIDMDDIETRILNSFAEVKGVAMTLKGDHLVAQIQPADIDIPELMTHVRNHVPAYAIPRYVLAVDSFPLTPVGKLDYKKIEAYNYATSRHERRNNEQSFMENLVASAVRTVLELPNDSVIDLQLSFAELGGHSLLYLEFSRRLSKDVGRHVPLQLILRCPSLEALAASLQALSTAEASSDRNSDSQDSNQLAPIEQDWWHKHEHGASSSFNVTYACEIGTDVDVSRLTNAWNITLSRHRILSSFYRPCEQQVVRREYHRAPPTVQICTEIDIEKEAHVLFDLRRSEGHEYLVRVLISPTKMIVVISHAICDLTTLRILLEDVKSLYAGVPLRPITKDYSQVQWSTPGLERDLDFWTEYLSQQQPPRFPIGENVRRTSWDGTSYVSEISSDTYQHMRRFVASQKITMHQMALGAVALALQHQSNACDITLGAPYLNRNTEEDQSVVGLFLEPLPVRIQYSTSVGQDTSPSFMQAVQKSSRAALAHAVPWNQLLSHLELTPDYPNHPISDVMVTFHEKSLVEDFAIPGTKHVPMWTQGAKFKIMAEFSVNADEQLSLRLEYSIECFTHGEMELLSQWIGAALEGLARNMAYEDIQDMLVSMSVAMSVCMPP